MTIQARPTIHEVSRVAGVSISSVSRALNGHTTNEELVERVREAARAVGYVPNAPAQSLRSRRVGQVALAVEDIGNPAYLAMVRAAQPVLREAGMRLVLHSTSGIVRDEIEVVSALKNGYVDGLIICPIRPDEELLQALSGALVPVVVIGSLHRDLELDNVRGDSRVGADLAVEHLLGKGARSIGLINGPADTIPAQARLQGYREALNRHQLLDETLVEEARGFSFEDGLTAAQRLLARTEVDAVLGTTDRLALGAMRALRDRGLSTPDDVRVVGMDDSEVAITANPSLTSVNLGAVDRGRLAAELLIGRLQDPELPPRSLTVAATLTERESSR